MNKTKKLATMGILTAMSVIFVALVHFPIFPAVSFLEYDPADIPILICGFAFGPWAGLAVTLVAAVIQGVTVSAQSGIYGIIMHLLSTGVYVTVSSLLYAGHKTRRRAVAALAARQRGYDPLHVWGKPAGNALFHDGRGERGYGIGGNGSDAVHPAV